MHPPASPPPPAPLEWQCRHLPAAAEVVGPAVEALATWLCERGVTPGTELDALNLALSEALNNAILHGRPAAGPVRLAWCWRDGELELEVSEPGIFTPAADWAELPEDPLAESGRGGYLITSLMDAVEHRNRAGRHLLRLRKRLPWQAPAAPAETAATLDAMTEELGNAYETIAALFQFAESLATEPELGRLAAKSCAQLLPLLAADAAWVRLAEPDGRLRRLAATGPAPGPEVIAAESDHAEVRVARTEVERTLEHRASLAADDPLAAPAGCAFLSPFAFEGRLRGVLTVVRNGDQAGFFTAGQTGLARTLADFLGIACANTELQAQRQAQSRARGELEIAARIQQSLLPTNIADHPTWRAEGVCTQAAAVGGDFYDIIDRADGTRVAVIADVMGKGVPAALLAATLRTALRSHARAATDPGALLTLANAQLCADLQRLEMFITAQVVWLDPTGRARAAAAGHGPVLSLRADGPGDEHDFGGLPLGVEAEETYQTHDLPPAAGYLLMTDGALEHEDAYGEWLGLAGVTELVREVWPALAEGRLGAALLAALARRAHDRAAGDDCTFVTLHRQSPSAP
jgi:serine phosphatase RsbU (regulator of sigma subunit)/anti-sigma regulatory factor (Ser/Thr protein kinase)